MEKTFAYRRHEVVCDAPMAEDFMARWPALFEVIVVSYPTIRQAWLCYLGFVGKGRIFFSFSLPHK
jgi:hypothetical protein